MSESIYLEESEAESRLEPLYQAESRLASKDKDKNKNKDSDRDDDDRDDDDRDDDDRDDDDQDDDERDDDERDDDGKDSKKIKGTDGDDVLVGDERNNHIDGKDGDDEIYGLGGNDQLDGDDGDDFLSGGEGNDKLDGKDGNDVIHGGAGNDKIEGGDGDDVLEGDDGNDKLEGKDGDDVLSGGAGKDKLDGGVGNDSLRGGLDKDKIDGGKGDDTIIWNAGDGEDKIDGGKGEDTFQLTTSDLVSQNVHIDVNKKGNLVVTLDGGAQGGELELKDIENLNLQFGLAGATIELGENAGEALGDAPLDLSGGEGSDAIDASSSTQPVNIDAGTGDDAVTGGSGADTISGGEGSDVISGGGGDDIIDAGVGDDRVVWSAGDGNDQIDGGEGFDELDLSLNPTEPSSLSISADADGNVILIAEDGTQLKVDGVEDIVINAGAAGTTLTIGDLTGTDIAQDTLYFVGGAGADSLDASATDRRINAKGNGGNDVLISGSGNDTLDGGDGNDILDAGGGQGVDTVLGGAGDDTISTVLGDEQGSNAIDIVDGGAGTDQLNVIFVEPTPHDLLLRVQSNGDGSFTVTSEDIDVDENVRVTNVENLKLTAGDGALNFVLDSLSDTSLAQSGVDFEGSAEADFFDGASTDVVLNLAGNAGSDALIGGSGNDTLRGGADNDSLSGSDGDDRLIGDLGDDFLDGGEGQDTADYSAATGAVSVDLGVFSAQDTVSAGMDTLINVETVIGSAFADTLTANALGNNLQGGAGDDLLTGGDGFDFLNGGDGNDTLIDPNNGLLSGDAGDDFLDGTAHYENDGAGVAVNYSDQAVDVHGDGSLVLAARTARDGYGDTDTFGDAAVNLHASNHDDSVTGSDANQFIWLRAGDDQASALGGNDTFFAGSGDDVLDGGDGFDFVNYQDDGFDGNGAATQGINANLATGTIVDGFGDTDSVSNIEGIIGSELDDTVRGDDNNNNLFARGGDDTIHGGGGDDVLAGWSGDDAIHGDAGNDTLIGDADDDILSGGAGQDTYRFSTFSVPGNAFGHDTITDFDTAEDVLDLSLFEISSLADFQAIASDDGSDTTVTIDAQRSIVLQNVTVAEFTPSNFLFSDPPEPGLTGTEDNDVLTGTPGDDSIAGLGSSDVLAGLAGDDILDGGDDRDTVDYNLNGAGAGVSVDLTLGTATDGSGDTDTLISIENVWGSDFADTIIGDAGDNQLYGDRSSVSGGADIILAGAGNDSIISGPGIDTIDGGDGIDILYLTRDGVKIFETGLQVTFNGDGSITSYNPGNGETESGISGIESVVGTLGHDQITGNADDNFIQGFIGDDVLDGGAGIDTVLNTVGTGSGSVVNLEAGFSFVPGKPWAGTATLMNFENVIGSGGDDVLIGDAQNNVLEGIDGNDVLRGGDGDDLLNGGVSTLDSRIGDPAASYNDTADYSLDPAAVTVNIAAGTASDGYGGTDTLLEIDSVNGSAFSDVLIGDAGANDINGLGGDDLLTGGLGADRFGVSDDESGLANFGHDTVTDFDVLEDVVNVRAFTGIAAMAGLNISQDGLDTLITFDASNTLRLQNVTAADLTESNFDFIESLNLVGTADDDTLNGGEGNDSLFGLGGNDQLFGNDGDDFIDGGAGDDNIHGGAGRDTLNGGSGWDNIWGDGGNDVINTGADGGWANGGEGSDTITGVNNVWDHLEGGVGDDVLADPDGSGFVIGGPGNDSLDGLLGYEQDPAGVTVNMDSVDWNINSQVVAARTAIDGYGDTDTLLAGAIDAHGTYFDDYFQGSEFSQYLNLRAGDDTAYGLDGDDNFVGGSGDDYLDGGNGFDNIRYRDDGYDGGAVAAFRGVVVNISAGDFDYGTGIALANSAEDNFGDRDSVFNIDSVDGSAMDDVLIGSDQHNWLRGHAGDDKLYGNGDSDNLVGGPGNDILDGGAGDRNTAWYDHDQPLHGINANLATGIVSDDGFGTSDTLINIDSVEGSDFADVIVGDGVRNVLIGRGGDDVIHGAGGDDHIEGRSGNDQAFGEDGFDWLVASPGDDLIDGGADNDTADYQSHVGTTSGISVDMSTLLSAGGFSNVVVASDGFGGTDYLRSIERIYATDFDDFIMGDASNNGFFGAGGNDTLNGGDGNDSLYGEDDFDTLNGGAGSDRLDGGENDDSLTGGSEGDTFSFSRFTDQGNLTSFGEDVITDFALSEDRLDLYKVPEFTSLEAVLNVATQDGSDVLISFVTNDYGIDETNSIRIQNVLFSDLPNMNIGFSPIKGSDGDDVLNGGPYGESLEGLDGNDILNGGGGADRLAGGRGDDVLDGGSGVDSTEYRFSGELHGVNVNLATGVTLDDGFGDTDTLISIENVDGSEFSDQITGDAQANYLSGREGDDSIFGGGGDDLILGDEGNDQLFGEDGDDRFHSSAGDDLIDGGAGRDQVHYDSWTGTSSGVTIDLSVITPSAGGHADVVVVSNDGFGTSDYLRGIEDISGSNFADALNGGPENNFFSGREGNDTLSGNAGDDSLHGDGGNDVLFGGAGSDFFTGGPGNDSIDGGDDWDNLAYNGWSGVLNGVNVNLALNTVSDDGYGNVDTVFNIERVQGSDFDDVIAGDSAGNHLLGNGGNDTLSGGSGGGTLEGGAGDDLFVLSDGEYIQISDFVAGAGSEDVIDLQAVSSLTDFNEVLLAATDDGSGNVNIDTGGATLHLVGVLAANLHVDDFLF